MVIANSVAVGAGLDSGIGPPKGVTGLKILWIDTNFA